LTSIFLEAVVTATLKIIRIKRYSSYADRMSHPDWKKPELLTDKELEQLAALHGVGRSDFRKGLEAMIKQGGEMLYAQQADDGASIVATMTFAFVPTMTGLVCMMTGHRFEGDAFTSHAALRETLLAIVAERGAVDIQSIDRAPRARLRRSDVSELDRADRMSGPFPERREADEDGPSTTQLPIVGRKR
jgi:hypothetical protein